MTNPRGFLGEVGWGWEIRRLRFCLPLTSPSPPHRDGQFSSGPLLPLLFISLPFHKSARRDWRWGVHQGFALSPGWLAPRRINDLGRHAAGVTQLVCVGLRPRWSASNWNRFPWPLPSAWASAPRQQRSSWGARKSLLGLRPAAHLCWPSPGLRREAGRGWPHPPRPTLDSSAEGLGLGLLIGTT